MTLLHNTGPLGPVIKETTLARITAENVPGIQQVIGMSLLISESRIGIVGKRWPEPEPGSDPEIVRSFPSNQLPNDSQLVDWVDCPSSGNLRLQAA